MSERPSKKQCVSANSTVLNAVAWVLLDCCLFDEISRGIARTNKAWHKRCEDYMHNVSPRESNLLLRVSPAWQNFWACWRDFCDPSPLEWTELRACRTSRSDLVRLANELATTWQVRTYSDRVHTRRLKYQDPHAVLRTIKLLRGCHKHNAEQLLYGCMSSVVLQLYRQRKRKERGILRRHLPLKRLRILVHEYQHVGKEVQTRIFARLLDDPNGAKTWRGPNVGEVEELRIAPLAAWQEAAIFLWPFVKQQAGRPVAYHWLCYFSNIAQRQTVW